MLILYKNMSPYRKNILIFGLCFIFISYSMAADSFEEEAEEDEDYDRPAAAAPVRQKSKAAIKVESSKGNNVQNQIDPKRLNCPLCDSSVYSYCSDKLLHDACCCLSPSDTDDLPPQCNYADCSFLHANTCREHRLITACCCNQRL